MLTMALFFLVRVVLCGKNHVYKGLVDEAWSILVNIRTKVWEKTSNVICKPVI